MKIKNLLLALSFLFSLQLFSQIQVGLHTGIKHGNLQESSKINFFESNTAFSSGVNFRVDLKSKIYITTSLHAEQMGWSLLAVNFGLPVDIYVKGVGYAFSVEVGYYILDLQKIQLGISSGLKSGNVFNYCYDYYYDVDRNTIIDIFGARSGYQSVEFKADLIYKLSDRFNLSISPTYSHFVRKYSGTTAERNIGLQTSLSYKLAAKS